MSESRSGLLAVLLVEDLEPDVRLFKELMASQNHQKLSIQWVTSVKEAVEFIGKQQPDVILLDLNLPDGRGIQTFERLARASRSPIIVLSGMDDEELAIEAVHKGAQDYLVKWEIDAKSMMRAMRHAIERHQLLRQLEEARSEIRSLRNLIPICAYCKRVRHDDGYWQQLESFLQLVGILDFSHGICPDCFDRLDKADFPDHEDASGI